MTLLRANDLQLSVIKEASIGEVGVAPLTPCATTSTFVSITEQLSLYLGHLSGDMGRVINVCFRMFSCMRYRQKAEDRFYAG
jgi:hypothetical protein